MYHNQILFEVGTLNSSNEEFDRRQGNIKPTEEIKEEKVGEEIKEELLLEGLISKDEIIKEKVGEEIKKEKVGEESNEIIKEYTLLKNNGGKITIKVLKDLLQRLNIKSSGKKEELQDRIENLINA